MAAGVILKVMNMAVVMKRTLAMVTVVAVKAIVVKVLVVKVAVVGTVVFLIIKKFWDEQVK